MGSRLLDKQPQGVLASGPFRSRPHAAVVGCGVRGSRSSSQEADGPLAAAGSMDEGVSADPNSWLGTQVYLWNYILVLGPGPVHSPNQYKWEDGDTGEE